MKGKTFLILLVAVGVLAVLMMLRLRGDETGGRTQMGSLLLADLPLNQVARVTIAGADGKVDLIRADTGWQVEERGGYPADFAALRDMVVKLSRLKIGRSFTADEAALARMALLEPSAAAESGKGTRITLNDASGKVLADLIMGAVRKAGDGGSGGQYVKRAGKDTVFLVDGSFPFLKKTPAQWLDKEMLNIPAAEIASVTVYGDKADAPVYTLARAKRGEEARLQPLPPGRTADPARVDQVLDALSPLSLDDVAPADGAPAAGPRLVYRLFDGRQISIFPHAEGKDHFTLRVSAASTPALDTPPAQAAAADDAQSTTEAAEQADNKENGAATPDAEKTPAVRGVQEIDAALGPWVFSVKKWQFDSFVTDPASLLTAQKTATGKGS